MFHIALASPRAAAQPAAASGAISDVTVALPTRTHAIRSAYAAGDAPLAEQLFLNALDAGLPWDMACTAAAEGIAAHQAGKAAFVEPASGATVTEPGGGSGA
jgi:hypothetical protein